MAYAAARVNKQGTTAHINMPQLHTLACTTYYAVMARILLVIKAYFRDINANTWIQYMENTRKIQQMERVSSLTFAFDNFYAIGAYLMFTKV